MDKLNKSLMSFRKPNQSMRSTLSVVSQRSKASISTKDLYQNHDFNGVPSIKAAAARSA